MNKQTRKQGFMQGIIALMFSQVIIKILGLVYKWYLTNKEGFGDKGNAIYSAGFSIYALLLTLSSTGVPNAIAKLTSEHIAKGDYRGAHRIFKIALITFSSLGFLGTFILFFGAHFIANHILYIPEAEMCLVALSPAIFFVSIISVFKGYFNGRRDMKVTANSQTIEQLSKTMLAFLIVEIIAIMTNANTNLMAVGANLSTTLATITGFLYMYTYYRNYRTILAKEIIKGKSYPIKSIIGTIKKILSVSIPMSLSAIVGSISRNIDSSTVVRSLQRFLSKEEATLQYGILCGKVDTLVGLPMSFNIALATALVPTISATKAKGREKDIEKKISFSFLITTLIGLPCVVGFILYAEPILTLLFPNASQGASILQASAISIIFILWEQTTNATLQGLGKVVMPAIFLLIGVIAKFICNILLVPIPQIGIIGASISTATCHAIAFLLGFMYLKKQIQIPLHFTKWIVKPLIACFFMAVSSYAVYYGIIQIIGIKFLATMIALLSAVIVYIASVFLLKILSQEEIERIPLGRKIYQYLQKIHIY